MTAEVLSLPRGNGPAPLVPAGIDARSADFMASDIKLLQKRSARMTAEHFGVWSRLHIASHLEEVTGTLPNDDVDLAIAAGFTAEGVDRWLAMKAKVLEDWLLCADGRWHHPSRARNVLHIWIGGRERDRRSALGNKSKSAKARATIAALEDAIEFGRDALARIDQQDRFLLGLDERISRWPSKADLSEAPITIAGESCAPSLSSVSYYGAEDPDYVRNTTSTATINETKRSEVKRTVLSSPRRGDDSPNNPETPNLEVDLDRGSVKRTPRPATIVPWPPDWLARIKAIYPRKEAWGRGERVLERVRKAGKVAFDDLIAGIERLIAQNRPREFTPLLATWVNDRGWEDEAAAQHGPAPLRGARTSPAHPGSEPSITQRAAMLAAERLGLLDEPRSRG